MFTVWHGLFILVIVFPRLRIEAPPLSTVQGKCIYTIVKAENQEIQFPLLCTKPSIDKHKYVVFQKLVVPIPFYRSSVPQYSNEAGRFIGHPCQVDKFFRPIYRSTAAKGLRHKLTYDYNKGCPKLCSVYGRCLFEL